MLSNASYYVLSESLVCILSDIKPEVKDGHIFPINYDGEEHEAYVQRSIASRVLVKEGGSMLKTCIFITAHDGRR